MVRFTRVFAVAVALCAVALTAQARPEKDEKTLKGSVTCAKCDLKATTKCATVIVVKEKDKDVVYYFDTPGHKKHHGAVCTEAKNGSVTGVVSEDEKEKRKVITVSELKFD